MKLLVATGNAGKLREIRQLLAGTGIEALGLTELAEPPPPVVEDGATFLANARKKAWTLARATGLPVLADDSGLAVAALGGRPGVHSARYGGEGADDAANNRKLLLAMQGVPAEDRGAEFVCAMVLAVPGSPEREAVCEGRLEGSIARAGAGSQGFGYDPLFVPVGHHRTLGELGSEVKNRISHRQRALHTLLPQLRALADGDGCSPAL